MGYVSTMVSPSNDTIEIGPGPLKMSYSSKSGQLKRMFNSISAVSLKFIYFWKKEDLFTKLKESSSNICSTHNEIYGCYIKMWHNIRFDDHWVNQFLHRFDLSQQDFGIIHLYKII